MLRNLKRLPIQVKKLPILTLDWTKFEKMPKRGQTDFEADLKGIVNVISSDPPYVECPN